MTRLLMSLIFLASSMFAQANMIKVTYKPQTDPVKDQLPVSLSGSTVAIQGKEGRWEKQFTQTNGQESVVFTEHNPDKPHVLSIRALNMESLNGHVRKNGYEGEMFKYELPPGVHNFELAATQCQGKKTDVSITYALFVSEDKAILPIGFKKQCKRRLPWQR